MVFHQAETGGAHFLTFENLAGLSVTLCNVGASLFMVKYEGKPMVMAPSSKETFIRDKVHYYGQTIGPIALRLSKGEFKVVDKKYRFPPNEKGNANHSSIHNFGWLDFETEVKIEAEATKVIFHTRSELPPEVGVGIDIEVTYTIYERQARFDLDYKLIPDADYCLNPTNHIYWNLGHIDVKELTLTLPASFHLRYDKELLCKKRRVAVTPVYDFRNGKKIGEDIHDSKLQSHPTHGYDHYFFLDEGRIVLEDEQIRMTLNTDAEGVQIYTGNYPVANNRLYQMGGRCEIDNSGVTFETLGDPRPWGMPYTSAGQALTQHNSYAFERK